MKRMSWSVYLALWATSFLFVLSALPLWLVSPVDRSDFREPPRTSLYGFFSRLPAELRGPTPPAVSYLWDNVVITLEVLALGAGVGFVFRWRTTRPARTEEVRER